MGSGRRVRLGRLEEEGRVMTIDGWVGTVEEEKAMKIDGLTETVDEEKALTIDGLLEV